MRRKRWVCAAVGSAMVAALGAGVAGQTPAYQPPRTPWGDPDLQGKWPGAEMVGGPVSPPPHWLERGSRSTRRRSSSIRPMAACRR